MSERGHDAAHGQSAVAEAPHGHDAGHGDGHTAVADLKFEKSELRDFEAEDRAAGRNIGVLLAIVFCILLFLMTGVTIWTTSNRSTSHDPHDIPSAASDAGHH